MPSEQNVIDNRWTAKNKETPGNGLLPWKLQNRSIVTDVPKSLSAQDCLLDINEKRLLFSDSSLDQDETDEEPTGSLAPLSVGSESRPRGWYAARKAYRSVAYKTWTVGAARKILNGPKKKNVTTIRRNGFISDSDSNLDDDLYVAADSSRNFRQNFNLNNNGLRSELCKLNDDQRRKAETARDSNFSRLENGNLKITNAPAISSKKRYAVHFDGKTEVDQEFRAVIDTFKDLQNFISANKNNYNNNNNNNSGDLRTKNINQNINNNNMNGNHYSGSSTKIPSKESSTRSSNISNFCEKIDRQLSNKRFANMNQAIRFLKDELNNIRQKDFMILQNLNQIKSEIRSSTESFPSDESFCTNAQLSNVEPNLPPIPKCLIIK